MRGAPRHSVRIGRTCVPSAAVLCGAGWIAGLATTAVVLLAPDVLAGSRSPTAHLLLSTVDACVALLVTYLLLCRFIRRRRLQDVLLAEAFLALASAGAVAELVPAFSSRSGPGPALAWSVLTMRVTAAVLVVTAALVGHHRRLAPERRALAAGPLLLVAVAVTAVWARRDVLPDAVVIGPRDGRLPVLDAHLLLLSGQVVGGLAFAVASVTFARQAWRHHDELVLWLGPACALAACARACYLLYPSLYTDWVYAGDALRTACYALLVVGAAREIGAYWHGYAGAAVLEDRRRLARELHDGVVQELAYLRGAALDAVPEERAREDIVGACDRALDEARAAVDVLGRAPDEPLALTLHRAAQQVADRYGGRVLVDLDDSIQVDQERRHALVRIAREAVGNALRHGRPDQVCLRLEREAGTCRLVVEDDGRGFDPSAGRSRSGGYGLTSMRDRARALPGDLAIRSAPGSGTAVMVTWPGGPAQVLRSAGLENEGAAR